jgi:hypothetical protein
MKINNGLLFRAKPPSRKERQRQRLEAASWFKIRKNRSRCCFFFGFAANRPYSFYPFLASLRLSVALFLAIARTIGFPSGDKLPSMSGTKSSSN